MNKEIFLESLKNWTLQNGLYIITGNEWTGKTTLINEIKEKIKNVDFITNFNLENFSTSIDNLEILNSNIDNIEKRINEENKKGIIVFDDADKFASNKEIILDSLKNIEELAQKSIVIITIKEPVNLEILALNFENENIIDLNEKNQEFIDEISWEIEDTENISLNENDDITDNFLIENELDSNNITDVEEKIETDDFVNLSDIDQTDEFTNLVSENETLELNETDLELSDITPEKLEEKNEIK